jgi:iron complex outermembrane recepter protein
MKISIILFSFLFINSLVAQSQQHDTTKENSLPEVVIHAFEHNNRLKNVPVAINYVGERTLKRYSPYSIVMAVNSTPGVHMEERSPGSYRFNIRGSSLRSPFGVRNVKVYYNDIPITDPGGQTYLNQLGYYNFNTIEIIKGPGSSIYGAGTGGVLLIRETSDSTQPGIALGLSLGSYGSSLFHTNLRTSNGNWENVVNLQVQKSTGYRVHSSLHKEIISWNGIYKPNQNQLLKTTFLLSNLFYETPGGLNLAEYTKDPSAARPGTGSFPGAIQSHASIRQKEFIAGLSFSQKFASEWQNKTTAYGMFTELKNPTFRNYGKNAEPHAGVRSSFQYEHSFENSTLKWNTGTEWQQELATIDVYKNKEGSADSLQTHDDLSNRSWFFFSQASLNSANWIFSAGASLNKSSLELQRFQPITAGVLKRNLNYSLMPRLSISRKLKDIMIYTSMSKGFSPPTTAELSPSGSALNLNLQAEQGTNYELGFKANTTSGLYIDINAFYFSLENTIVQRKDTYGGDYYVNAGKTDQKGIETYLSYPLLSNLTFINNSLLWVSHTYHNFKYKSFKQINTDFTGKLLPGVPPHSISAGLVVNFNKGIFGNIAGYYSDKIALNDANSEFGKEYYLLSLNLGYLGKLNRWYKYSISGGIENLLDQEYSLGNDINVAGGRYYNAAPRRSFFISLQLDWMPKKQ